MNAARLWLVALLAATFLGGHLAVRADVPLPAPAAAVTARQDGVTPTAPVRKSPPPVQGVVRDTAGRPVPGLTLYMPGAWRGERISDDSVVAVGSGGSFVWERPPTSYAPSKSNLRGTTLGVLVLPADRSRWDAEIHVSPDDRRFFDVDQLLRVNLYPAKTHWEGTGQAARLVVEAPPMGSASTAVRAPDGRPVANAPIEVWLTPHWPSAGASTARFRGRTDAAGRFTLRLFPGPCHLTVVAPGVGSGNTGRFEVRAGRTTDLDLPRLAPFGTIAGKVAPEIARPGQVVRLSRSAPPWFQRQTRTTAGGGFVLSDVPPGNHTLWLFDTDEDAQGESRIKTQQDVTVAAGTVPAEITLQPLPLPERPALNSLPQNPPGVLTGRVRDGGGNPVAGATVWAVYITSRIPNSIHYVLQTITGPDGAYRIEGIPSSPVALEGGVYIRLTAYKTGRPPALGYAVASTAETSAPDMVLMEGGATLLVRVLGPDAKPQAGVMVEAASPRSYITPRNAGEGSYSRAETVALRGVFAPRAVTDASGIARFPHLLPDRYELAAIPANRLPYSHQDDHLSTRLLSRVAGSEIALAQGVPVGAAGETRFDLRLQKLVGPLRVRRLLPDGKPIGGASFGIVKASAPENEYPGWHAKSEDETKKTFDLNLYPGVWRLSVGMRSTPPYAWTDREPLLFGQTVVAYSPYRQRTEKTVDIQTAPRGPGRLAVQVVDENDRPVRGTVYLKHYPFASGHGEGTLSATTDEAGRTVLPGLESGRIRVYAEAEGDPALPVFHYSVDGPLPSDENLTNRRRWPATAATIRSDEETRLTLRAERVGWLRGIVQGAPDGWFFPLNLGDQKQPPDTDWRYDERTGEYLIGPLPPGPFTLYFRSPAGYKHQRVAITAGQVTRLDFTPEAYPAAQTPAPAVKAPPAPAPTDSTPPAQVVPGRVTVGGRPFGPSCPGVVQVCAVRTEPAQRGDAEPLETTAQSDGTFTLAGLTPGTYVVQATLDNIWFSASIKLTVEQGGELPILALDIAEPGDPLVAELGAKLAGAKVHLADPLPSGPYSDRYQPAFYVADGAGQLRLEGLPAGPRRLRLLDGEILSVTIPRSKGAP